VRRAFFIVALIASVIRTAVRLFDIPNWRS
jgi:hypothetical protein